MDDDVKLEWHLVLWNRFAKGMLSTVAAFLITFLVSNIPLFGQWFKSAISDPILAALVVSAFSALVLALQKWWQGYNPEVAEAYRQIVLKKLMAKGNNAQRRDAKKPKKGKK